MSDPFIRKLTHPFVSPVNKATIETVTMRQPLETVDWLAGAKVSTTGVGAEVVAVIVGRLTGLVPAEVEKMAYSDYKHFASKVMSELVDDEGKE